MTLRAQAMSGLRWTVGARLLAQVVTWTITLVVIRLLSPSDYGLLAMATIFVAFLSMVSELGLGLAVVQSADIDERELRKVFGAVLATHFCLAALLVAGAPLIADFFAEARVIPIVRALSLLFVINAFAVIPDALLQRRMEFRARALSDLGSAVTGSLVILGLATTGFGVWALVAGSLTTNFLKTAALNVWAPFRLWPSFALKGMGSLLTFGGRMTLVQFLWFFFNQVDVLIVGRWLGKDLLGLYSVAMHVASMPNQRLSALINQVAFPTFARLQHDVHKVAGALLNVVGVLGFAAFPLFWGISSVAPELVNVVLGSKWGGAVLPLALFSLVMPLRLINTAVSNAVQGMGRSDRVLLNVIWACILTPPALLVGVNWGLPGVVVAWLVVSPIVFVQNMLRSLPVTGVRHALFWKALVPSAASALLMYAAVWGARATLPDSWPGWIRLGALVLVGVGSYVAAGWLINRRTALEALRLAKEVMRPARPKAG
jgi:O-antigen/teichoic acid export membrane protein